LGEEEDLEKENMLVSRVNMIKYDRLDAPMEALTKIRYKDKGSLSKIEQTGNNVNVQFYEKAKGIAPGQSAVFYEGNDVIGGGIIQKAGF
jgi:tRNA-uridine 2-sulfurtransferase